VAHAEQYFNPPNNHPSYWKQIRTSASSLTPSPASPNYSQLLSPFAKSGGKKPYSNSIHYDHCSTLKTLQEIFHGELLLGALRSTPKQEI